MLPDSITVAAITGISTLSAVALTAWVQTITTQRNQRFELTRESLRIKFEISEKRAWLMREKLEKAHIILSEISREFSLTFLTID